MIPEIRQEIVNATNLKTPSEKVKLIGLHKHLSGVYDADEIFELNNNKIAFENGQKINELSQIALQIMNGKQAFSKDMVVDLSEYFTPEELASEEFKSDKIAPAPENLWLYLFDKAPVISQLISDEDRDVLKSLENVKVFLEKDSPNFSIEFTFGPNDYFTNDKLVLSVDVAENEVEEITSTEINWKPGKNIRMTEVEKKQKNKKTGQVRTIIKTEKQESFFWIFSHHVPVEEEEEEDEPEYNSDPLGDGALFYNASDAVQFLKDSFFTYFIPAAYGVEIKDFAGLMADEYEDDQTNPSKAPDRENTSPECKQQ
jgi:nucleosome assembly protein 1-like 1